MPLLDHFRPPLFPNHHCDSFHSNWATRIADAIAPLLPAEFQVEEHTHAGVGFEIDVEDHWYFIEKGMVALHPADEPFRELGPGDCFGERALAGWKGLPVAAALIETECLCLPRSAFESQSG